MEVQRFLLFAGGNYYPKGGWLDLFKAYSTAELARVAGEALVKVGKYDWWHIVDLIIVGDDPGEWKGLISTSDTFRDE